MTELYAYTDPQSHRLTVKPTRSGRHLAVHADDLAIGGEHVDVWQLPADVERLADALADGVPYEYEDHMGDRLAVELAADSTAFTLTRCMGDESEEPATVRVVVLSARIPELRAALLAAVEEQPAEAEPTHEGPSPYHGGLTTHRGRREDCIGPDCTPAEPEPSTPAPGDRYIKRAAPDAGRVVTVDRVWTADDGRIAVMYEWDDPRASYAGSACPLDVFDRTYRPATEPAPADPLAALADQLDAHAARNRERHPNGEQHAAYRAGLRVAARIARTHATDQAPAGPDQCSACRYVPCGNCEGIDPGTCLTRPKADSKPADQAEQQTAPTWQDRADHAVNLYAQTAIERDDALAEVEKLRAERDSLQEHFDKAIKGFNASALEIHELRARVAELEKRAETALADHTPHDDSNHCQHDGEQWPCPTVAALAGQP